ncbi:C25 family cysteine peptidase [Candidatus Uabimicrobium amorphum]|uniref:Gingipain R2 n=1 Tax=Uabimicrobium amorphum TaxID=2596890 RepID=A0A5S9F4C6_UABAM|nr:C25 family cysteine peptidase [Candidatus Uabimicrobium amorphum]BBM85388.1 Gingipain R2 [Candidatus Uabimicrobium amorphum]
MIRYTILAALLSCFLFAGEINLLDAQRGGVKLQWKLESFKVQSGEKYSKVEFPGGSGLYAVGKPSIPSQQAFIEVPQGATIRVRILNATNEIVELEKPLAPAQEPQIDTVGEEKLVRTFHMDRDAYGSDELFPANSVEIAYDGIMRGRRLALVRFNPCQYIAKTRELVVHKNIEVAIDFEGGSRTLANTDGEMDAIAKGLVLNYQPARNTKNISTYLILTTPELQKHAQSFAQWKNQKGLQTKIEVLSSRASSQEIRATIKKHYPEVAFVTLIGGHNLIPLSKDNANRHPLGEENCKILGLKDASVPSDLYYSCLEGDDYYPDVYIGRIPARNQQEADLLMQRIENYQRKPPRGDWQKRFLLCGEFQYQYSKKNVAERLFCETAFTIHHSLNKFYTFPERTIGAGSSGLGHLEYFFRTTAQDDPAKPGTYRDRIRDEQGPVVGCRMPQEWTKNIVSSVEARENTLKFWEEGAFLVQHRDHGSITGWGKPPVHKRDVTALKNGDKLPVLFSINCLTGQMDYSSDCFVEAALKNPNGGAVSALGSTRVSYSWWNDRLCDGFYTCLYGTEVYDCLDTGVQLPAKHSFSKKLGVVLNFGKMYLALNYPSNPFGTAYDYTETEFYLFHCIGDPEMQIWTGTLQDQQVAQKRSKDSLALQVSNKNTRKAIANATVCLYGENTQIVVKTDAQGNCTLPTTAKGTFTLTITGENLYPYQTQVTID